MLSCGSSLHKEQDLMTKTCLHSMDFDRPSEKYEEMLVEDSTKFLL